MAKTPCPFCAIVRLILICMAGGPLCGFAAEAAGFSTNLSMAVTFLGAFLPLLWFLKQKHPND
jgi:hypothetical protein